MPFSRPLSLLFAASLATFSSTLAANATVEHYWNIGWVPSVNPDGLQDRRAIGVNGTWPPPIINVNASDVLKVHATNNLGTGIGTALHSHGMFFNKTSALDGAVGTTQCPIPEGESFTYEPLNSEFGDPGRRKQYGTYWMHGHYKGQYVDGLRTPLIIHPDEPQDQPYKYDEDYTFVLGDWYHDEHAYLLSDFFLNRNNPTGAEPVPKSGLMYIASTPGNSSDAFYLPGFNENATLSFTLGKTYRLRIINMSALAMFQFYLDGHDMRVIEVDGVDTAELPVDFLPISVAQRYSVLVTARNDTTSDWKVHAHMNPDMFDVVPDDLQLNVTSRIAYSSQPQAFGPETIFDEFPYFDDLRLTPVLQEAMAPADVVHNLTVVFDTYADGQNHASFNGIVYAPPNTPTLLTQMSMGAAANNFAAYGPTVGALEAPHMANIEMTIFNTDAGFHPFHLHGHHFQVVHKSQDVTSDDPSINPPVIEGQANPMRRDTVMVPPGGSASLRFRADNPGAWLMHCHIEWHLESGLGLVVVEGIPEAQQSLYIPPQLTEQCRALGISPTGNAAGLNSTTDFTGLRASEPKSLESGWTAKAVGAFVGCAISAIVGILTVLVYGWSGEGAELEEEEEEEKER